MRARRPADLDWVASTATWPGDGFDWRDDNRSLSMLAEDAGLEVWHELSERSGGKDASIQIEGADGKLTAVIAAALSARGDDDDLRYSLAEFARMTIAEAVRTGEAVYEVRSGWESDRGIRRLSAVTFGYVQPNSLVSAWERTYQAVPSYADQQELQGKTLRVEEGTLFRVKAASPYELDLQRARRVLRAVDIEQHTWMEGLREERSSGSVREMEREWAALRARAVSVIGWNGRLDHFAEFMSEYHAAVRELRWQRFCITLREGLLERLDQAVRHIAQWYGAEAVLRWSGMHTLSDVAAAGDKLKAPGANVKECLAGFRRG